MHLRIIVPVLGESAIDTVRAEAEQWILPTTTLSVVSLARGTASIESAYDEVLAGPGIIDRVSEAAADGVDAIFITCFGDPAVHAARELVDVPVVGGFEPAVLTALTLGDRVGILSVLPNVVPAIRALGNRYGISDRIGAIRYVNIPVLGLEEHEVLVDRLEQQAVDVLDKEEADVFVLGCTGMLGVADAFRSRLEARGTPVPVIDPTPAAITWLESATRMNLRPSRTTYMPPATKDRTP